MIMEILAWATVIGIPLLIIVGVIYVLGRIMKWSDKHSDAQKAKLDAYLQGEPEPAAEKPKSKGPPSPLQELNVGIPEWASIDEEAFLSEEEEPVKIEAGTRVWRVYRSVDQQNWAECDPALTERAACNYATYIKRNNPDEYVRVNDPEGIIVSYE